MTLPLEFQMVTLLIIEDDMPTRLMVTRMVKNLGIQKTHFATDGFTGLATLRQVRPDVVLCDINMEPMDGLAFVHEVGQDRELSSRRTPIIFMTSNPTANNVLAAKGLGINCFLVKPVTPDMLKQRLMTVLQ